MKKVQILLAALLVITVLAACNQDEDKKTGNEETVTSVETMAVTKGDMIIKHTEYGHTAPGANTPVMLQAPGEIKTLEVENGEQVTEDDVIATVQTQIGTQTIYAESSGQIASLQGEEGSIATTEKPLAVIIDLNELTVNMTVTAEATSLFKEGETYPATVKGNEVDAEVTAIDTLPNDTGLYPIEATISNKDDKLLPGMVAEINVPEKTVKDALIVPTEAVTEESGNAFIYVIKDDKAIEKKVQIIETQSDQTAIKGEVKKGDKVVTSGQLTLTDGSKVNVVKEG
ncbi:efflux transporter periplasmic adaptor subunit [Virgibacillus phasianinus]|uniref:Efflux transporter periplasmic adaptor subunit n=1 Tax=Virgibacillus phasianinus TaxID=2017483 RepID=A0A220U2Q3_9BACI|nr:efflux RND transporter periplasmic adaptor subunit [Virgibacillus phasianinus]ASK62121.1 efflux transporter periplasmic adaptor subunit [Virgibacillus phasianinus]